MLALGVMKRQTPAMTVLDLPHVKFGVPFTEFKHQIRQYVFFSFFFFFFTVSASPVLLQAVQGGWSWQWCDCVDRTRLPHISRSKHHQCILTVRHIMEECNNFAQTRKYILGKRDMAQSFRFYLTLVLLFFGRMPILFYTLTKITVIIKFSYWGVVKHWLIHSIEETSKRKHSQISAAIH